MDKLVAPDPNKDLLRFFGKTVETFDFYGLSPKAIPIKVGEFEMESKLKMLAISEASEDHVMVLPELFDLDKDRFHQALKLNNLAVVSLGAKPGRDVPLLWLQWLLANRGVEVTMDELKMRVGYDAVNEFVEQLTPAKKAVAEGRK